MKSIFVSSTFRDFQQERDVLHDTVLPQINQLARKYGETVGLCDLRWGIDTLRDADEMESSAKVLSVCLNEIDRSRPYFLVLLGERYGFMPGADAIAHESARKNIALEELEISVTALEIEYGALRDAQTLENTYFYFRTLDAAGLPAEYCAETEIHKQKLAALKKRVAAMAKNHVRFYTPRWAEDHVAGLDDFARQVCDDLTAGLTDSWKAYAALDVYARDTQSQWNYITEKNRYFCAGEKFFQEQLARLRDKETSLVICGAAGSGKTTLFSHIALQMQQDGWTVLPFCCGVTAHSTDAAGILRSAVWQLETLTGQPHFEIETRPDDRRADKKSPTLQDWREQLTALCALYSADGKRLLLAVDAVDQLLSDDPAAALQFLPCRLTDTVKTFITCLDTFPLPGKLAAASLPALSKEDRRIALTSILTAHGKTLSQPVENALVCKEDAHNPLYLYLAVSRLLLMNADDFAAIHSRGDGIQAIVAQQIELIAGMPGDLEAMGRALILEAGQRVNPAMAHAAAQYLAVSRHGLRLDDLAALLAADAVYFNALTFSQFVNYMNELFFLRADGRYDFMHKSLRAGLLSACENKQAMHASLVRH
ncbi:MAG: DUF4062 domain-containing protein, partial [Ruthenibacterium sp.]